jgi:hypothetical protein
MWYSRQAAVLRHAVPASMEDLNILKQLRVHRLNDNLAIVIEKIPDQYRHSQ